MESGERRECVPMLFIKKSRYETVRWNKFDGLENPENIGVEIMGRGCATEKKQCIFMIPQSSR